MCSRPICLLAAAAVLLLTGLAAAGCGGDSGSSESTGLSRAEFLKKGNAICRAGNRRLQAENNKVFRAYIKSGTQAPPAKVRAFVTGTLIPDVQAQVNQIRALPAPAGDEETVKKIIVTVQADLEAVKENPDLMLENKPVFEDGNRMAKAYGLTVCAGS